jgi:hypothetical protein
MNQRTIEKRLPARERYIRLAAMASKHGTFLELEAYDVLKELDELWALIERGRSLVSRADDIIENMAHLLNGGRDNG